MKDYLTNWINKFIFIYDVPSTFFVQAFKIVSVSWKLSMILLYILWDDWQILMISGSNEQLQQQLEYTLLNPDCHSWWISKMQSGREDTLEERYAIKFCFQLEKNATAMTQRSRDRVPSGSMLALPDPKRSDRANPNTNFWWSFFFFSQQWHDLHTLSSHWTDSQQRILCWGF